MANGNGGPPPPRPGGPGAKPPMKKTTRNWLLIGGIGAAGIVIWYVMRAKSQASQQASATDQSGVDPATGIPYAEEDQTYGGYGAGGYGAYTPSQFGYYDPTTGAYISGTGSTVLGPSTNASWAQQVQAYLSQLGYDPTTIGAALGNYLTGQPLTSSQQGIVQSALAYFGNPPQGAPIPITTTPSGSGSGGGGSTGWQSFKTLRVPHNMTLAQFAKAHGWTQATLAAVEKIDTLKPTSRLRKGQTIIRPVA
jgi:hypothetical protein